MRAQRGKGERHDRPIRREQIDTTGAELTGLQRHRGAEPTARPVALHRVAKATADGVRHSRRVVGPVGEVAQRDGAGSLPAGPREGLERRTIANAPDQAERRLRPRARRARSTARPPLVRMRSRNPWVLARLRLFGWYVRFNEEPPRGGRARPEVGDRAGGGNRQVYDPGDEPCNAERSLGKPPQPLVAQGCRCYVARFARRRPAGCASPVCDSSTRPTRAPLLNDLHTCGRSCGQLLPGRRTRRSGLYQAGPLTGGREKNGDR